MAAKKSAKRTRKAMADPSRIDPREREQTVRVVVETPKGSRNKYAFESDEGVFVLRKVLPAGMTFPFDFGFIPDTKAGDGDPLDVLILMDEPAFPGCVVEARLIGVFRAEEVENGKRVRNDRLIAVSTMSPIYKDTRELRELGEPMLRDLERFFSTYQKLGGKEFRMLGRGDAKEAARMAREAKQG